MKKRCCGSVWCHDLIPYNAATGEKSPVLVGSPIIGISSHNTKDDRNKTCNKTVQIWEFGISLRFCKWLSNDSITFCDWSPLKFQKRRWSSYSEEFCFILYFPWSTTQVSTSCAWWCRLRTERARKKMTLFWHNTKDGEEWSHLTHLELTCSSHSVHELVCVLVSILKTVWVVLCSVGPVYSRGCLVLLRKFPWNSDVYTMVRLVREAQNDPGPLITANMNAFHMFLTSVHDDSWCCCLKVHADALARRWMACVCTCPFQTWRCLGTRQSSYARLSREIWLSSHLEPCTTSWWTSFQNSRCRTPGLVAMRQRTCGDGCPVSAVSVFCPCSAEVHKRSCTDCFLGTRTWVLRKGQPLACGCQTSE